VWTFAIKSLDALGSLKRVSFDINHLYPFITPASTLNTTQLTKAATKHVKILTSFSLPIDSTLKFPTGSPLGFASTMLKSTTCGATRHHGTRGEGWQGGITEEEGNVG
jgi:hypothetical protein